MGLLFKQPGPALVLLLIETGAVDFVLQTVAGAKDSFGNAMQCSRIRAEVLATAGSRYIPSAPLAGLRFYLDGASRFVFVGKPCDVASLRRMALRNPRIDEKIPVMIAFMCTGIPSRNAVWDILDAMGCEAGDVKRFAFRGEGRPGDARVYLRDGSVKRMSYNDSLGKCLNRQLQFRCKICPDGAGEFADIVCADAGDSKDGYPDFSDRPGRSLILSRTSRVRGSFHKRVMRVPAGVYPWPSPRLKNAALLSCAKEKYRSSADRSCSIRQAAAAVSAAWLASGLPSIQSNIVSEEYGGDVSSPRQKRRSEPL